MNDIIIYMLKKFYILLSQIVNCHTPFNLLENNLTLKSIYLEKEKNYYNLLINHLLPFSINKSMNIDISPTFYSENLPFVFFKKNEGKKLVSIYNQTIYNLYYIKILNSEIDLLNKKISDLKNILDITSYEVLQEIKNTETIIIKKENEKFTYEKNIEENYHILENEFNCKNISKISKNPSFIVPFLSFNEKKINNYILKSYWYKKDFYELNNSFNNYISVGNLQFSYIKNKDKKYNFYVSYTMNLKNILKQTQRNKQYEFLQNILVENKIIKNKSHILHILKRQTKFLGIYKNNIENYINNYKEDKSRENLIYIYKKKLELLKIKKLQLKNLYNKVDTIFSIYLELLPLDVLKKIYEIPFC
jgi:hypothetical protein